MPNKGLRLLRKEDSSRLASVVVSMNYHFAFGNEADDRLGPPGQSHVVWVSSMELALYHIQSMWHLAVPKKSPCFPNRRLYAEPARMQMQMLCRGVPLGLEQPLDDKATDTAG